MELFYAKGACSLVVRIIVNEIGLDCEFESVDLKNKTTRTGHDFLKINPKGAVPVLQLDNGDILTENAVILQYLADDAKAFNLLPMVGDFNRYRVLEWLNYIATELHKSLGIMFNSSITQELKTQFYIPMIKFKFNYVNIQLENRQYLMGDHFTLPDAYLFVMLRWAIYFKFDLAEWSNLKRYFNALEHRESIQQSLKEDV